MEVLDVLPVAEDITRPPVSASRRPAVSRSSGMVLPFLAGCLLAFGMALFGLILLGGWWYSREQTPSAAAISGREPNQEEEPPKPAGEPWLVLLRSDDPSVWNTTSEGRNYAIPLNRAPATIRYLRLRRMDTGEMLILPLTRGELGLARPPDDAGGFGWNGTVKEEWGGMHLGIVQAPRHHFPIPRHMITVLNEGWDGWTGSGFGHQAFNDFTGQYYCWRGKQIGRTVFEISVTEQPLAAEEKRCLLER